MKSIVVTLALFLVAAVAFAQTNTFPSSGNVGIGTTSPNAPLHVFSSADAFSIIKVENNNATGTSAQAFFQTSADAAALVIASHGSGRVVTRYGITLAGWNEMNAWGNKGLIIGTMNPIPFVLGANGIERLRITPDGNIGINTTTPTEKLSVVGNIVATGSITGGSVIGATYQDIAEWVPASTRMAPGTVVVLNAEHTNEVAPSQEPYDTAVAGVVSSSPGVILGVGAEGKEKIATTGRVKVRVDATHASIAVGDLLVTSDEPGTAMKSEPIEINGRKFHQPGTVIGKALQPLASGRGEILVLLSLQ